MIDQLEYPFDHPAAEVVRRIFLRLPVYAEEDYHALSHADRAVWDVLWFETEIMNGGFDQFIWNSTGDHSAETLDALKTIRANVTHHQLLAACQLFPGGMPSRVREARQEQLRIVLSSHHVAGSNEIHLDNLLPEGKLEVELFQLLLDYWLLNRLTALEIDLSSVKSPADLLAVSADALGVGGSFGNDIDAFLEAVGQSHRIPRRLLAQGWDRFAIKFSADASAFQRAWVDLSSEFPELACELVPC